MFKPTRCSVTSNVPQSNEVPRLSASEYASGYHEVDPRSKMRGSDMQPLGLTPTPTPKLKQTCTTVYRLQLG